MNSQISARGRQDLPTSRGFLSALERAADLYAREQAAAPRPAHAESAAIPAGATSSSPSGELTMSTYDSPGRTADSDASLADSVPSSVGPSVLLPLDASLPQSPPTQVQRHTFISRHVGSGMQFLPAYGAVAGHAGVLMLNTQHAVQWLITLR